MADPEPGEPTWQQAVQMLTQQLDTLDRKTAGEFRRIEELARSAVAAQWQSRVTDQSVNSQPNAGVLIMRYPDGSVHAQHIKVHYTPLMDAADGIQAMKAGDYAFVMATAAGAVLDACGVKEQP
jgi:hypothetical protein